MERTVVSTPNTVTIPAGFSTLPARSTGRREITGQILAPEASWLRSTDADEALCALVNRPRSIAKDDSGRSADQRRAAIQHNTDARK